MSSPPFFAKGMLAGLVVRCRKPRFFSKPRNFQKRYELALKRPLVSAPRRLGAATAPMTNCLIALGSNLGERANQLRRALGEISRLTGTRLVARSSWHETSPVGGPSHQELFLNAAALVQSSLQPESLLAELRRIETSLGRTTAERWAARIIDLDLLIHGDAILQAPQLTLPHPRMTYRRFVLEPAAEIAPWLIQPECGWTISRLLQHLDLGSETVAVASSDNRLTDQLATRLNQRDGLSVVRWSPEMSSLPSARPKLILATGLVAGASAHDLRKMHQLPPTGPVAWVGGDAEIDPLDEAVAAVQSVWPARAANSVA
jgi:2-amino-4-hydroxy-6-hydroxymethyldihydropteridine diphosphokinase